ncbi:MAG: GTPase HflX [Solirubrobacterales bacterium]
MAGSSGNGSGPSTGGINGRARQRAMMIAVDSGGANGLGELSELLLAGGVAPVGEVVQQRSEPDPDRYFGRGKLEVLVEQVQRSGANLIACDDELAPRQERNLEKLLGLPVIDRTAIILDIFASHASSSEGKLQVELAQLEYNLARMRGLWTHLERLGAGIGTRGPGESQIETDRRLARDRIASLRRKIDGVERTRRVMRKRRQRSELPQIALAGYTNAGKSSLLGALCNCPVQVGDRPFHTLDPLTRSFEHGGARFLLTDTVGFIEKLPHQLVDAFRATLEETVLSDVLLFVVDSSGGPDRMRRELDASEAVLRDIGADDKPRVTVLNKVDLLSPTERDELRFTWPTAIQVSARTKEGIPALKESIRDVVEMGMESVDLLVPYSEGSRLSELHEIALGLSRTDEPGGVRVSAHLPAGQVHRFADLAV